MEKIELKDAFAEFKNQKNIDRATMMGVLETCSGLRSPRLTDLQTTSISS